MLGYLAAGQQPYTSHYTTKDGLPSNIVYNIYNDSKSYLWFATDKGIACYNGFYFKTFTTAEGVPDNEIFFFNEDYEGRLWMATFNGKLCFFQNNEFYTERNTPWLKIPKECTHITGINVEADSSVTIQFGSDLYFINIKGNKIKTIPMRKLENVI